MQQYADPGTPPLDRLFADAMAAAEPWPASRRVAVAVSGGADSLCLAFLAKHWGNPTGLIVDHGLRAESAAEARHAAAQLDSLGIPNRILTLENLPPGPGLAARARNARYAVLAAALQREGLADLLLGHHAADQAETVLMRQQARSGQAGLAGMAAMTETATHRIVRPLLAADPAMLRRTLRAAGIAWIEDPSNRDPIALRSRLRRALHADPARTAGLLAGCREAGAARTAREATIAEILAERSAQFPEGHALLTSGPIAPDALAALLRTLAGAAYPGPTAAIARMAENPSPGTLAGIEFRPAGRLGQFLTSDRTGLLLVREAAAMQPEIHARPGITWDNRFQLDCDGAVEAGTTIGPLAGDTPAFRANTHLPSAVLRTLPAIRRNGAILAIPHIGYFNGWTLHSGRVTLSPPVPSSGAPFARMQPNGSSSGDAQRRGTPHVA